MSGSADQSYSSQVLLSNKILLDLLPDKKGFLKKHAEYLITYDTLGTQVIDIFLIAVIKQLLIEFELNWLLSFSLCFQFIVQVLSMLLLLGFDS